MEALWVSVRLGVVTTLLLLPVALWVGRWLALSRSWWRYPVEALVMLPLALPPTVLGFYLLYVLGPRTGVGKLLALVFGSAPAFHFSGIVIASVLFSLPFAVLPLRAGYENLLEPQVWAAARMSGRSRWHFFRTVELRRIRPALLGAAGLTLAHAIGEFGVVLMVGGSIPGQTLTASIAVYQHMDALEYARAHALSALLLGLSFAVLLVVRAFGAGLFGGGRRDA